MEAANERERSQKRAGSALGELDFRRIKHRLILTGWLLSLLLKLQLSQLNCAWQLLVRSLVRCSKNRSLKAIAAEKFALFLSIYTDERSAEESVRVDARSLAASLCSLQTIR